MPLRAKLLIPFMVVMVASAFLGTVLLTRDAVRSRNDAATARLSQIVDTARATFSETRSSLLETARLGARTNGVAEAVEQPDGKALLALLPQIVANAGHDRLVVIDGRGRSLIAVHVIDGKAKSIRVAPTTDARILAVASGKTAVPFAGIVSDALVVAAPVRTTTGRTVGAVLVDEAAARIAASAADAGGSLITLFGPDGRAIGAAGGPPLSFRDPLDGGVRVKVERGGDDLHALYAPVAISDEVEGVVGVALSERVVAASTGGAVGAMIFLLSGVVVLVVWIGVGASRRVTDPIQRLVDATRSLGSGDLSARAEVAGRDEVGRLAEAFNAMAEDLQASYAELEAKVEERTAELRAANEQLARASEAKSQFLTIVSHELKTPLNAIIGFSSMLADPTLGKMPEKERRRIAGNIGEGGKHLLAIITDLLDLARIEAGKMRIDAKPFDLGLVLADAAEMIAPLAKQKRITLKVQRPRGLPKVVADRGRVRQVLYNLLSNAIKYSDEGTRVEVRARIADRFVELAVSDNGPGMTADEAKRIFSVFERGSASGKAEGTGVGLPLARHLVELNGGRMWLETKPGAGSTFLFSLPTVELVAPAVASDVA